MKIKISKTRKVLLKARYEQILDLADRIDETLGGSVCKDEIYRLVEKQAETFSIKLK